MKVKSTGKGAPLRVGVVRDVITPPIGTPLAGWSGTARNQPRR